MDASGSKANWAKEAVSSSPSRTSKKRAETDKPHVLIVEDNELVTGALRILFEETGRRVTVAHSVADAVAAGVEDAPDLILLDLTLPDGDGLEVVRALEQRGVHARGAIALTGRDDQASADRCAAAGVALLVKPVATKDLLSRAGRLLG